MEVQQNAVAQNRNEKRTNIFEAHVIAAFHQGASLRTEYQILSRADAATVVDVFLHDLRRRGIFQTCRTHQFDRILRYRFGDWGHANELLEIQNLLRGRDRIGLGDVRRRGQVHHLQFLGSRQVVQNDVEQEAVELSFGKWISALKFSRVLRRKNE